jgi:hypothetical protein
VQTHELKTLPIYWDAIKRGEKLFEVRKNDRFFQAGDTVVLIRTDARGNIVTGRREDDDEADPNAVTATGRPWPETARRLITRRIGAILQGGQFGIEPGYCVFSLIPCEASHDR